MRTSGAASAHQGTATLRDYLQVARRRKWIIVQAVVLVPLAAVLFSLWQTPVYQASADVLLSRQNLANTLNGLQDPTVYTQADRLAQTQADIAQSPEVARRVLAQLHLSSRTTKEFLANSSVSPAQNADVLNFTVKDTNRDLVVLLARAYAEQYRAYRHQLDTQALAAAKREVQGRIDALPEKKGTLYANLVDKEQQLSTMEALQTSNATVVNEPTSATQVAPRPKRNAALGLMLGLVLGIGLAFLRETLDTRVRSSDEIAERLGLPLLARIPEPPKRLRTEDKLAMLADPTGTQAEAYRMLRTNLEFTSLGRDVRTVMITSALEREGKSTTIANLAIALARGGQKVILVDLDLRRPYAYVAYRIGDGPDAEDVTSEAFARALRYRESFDASKGDVVAWLIGIARRCIAAHFADHPEEVVAETPERAGPGTLADEAVERLELARALATLPERDRELIALRYGADLTAKQIAELLGLRVNTVEVSLHRVLRRLRGSLEGGGGAAPKSSPSLGAVRI